MYRNLKIGSKVLVVFTSIAVLAVSLLGIFAFSSGSAALEEESFNKLTAVREMKASQIEDYFGLIADQVVTMSQDRMIVDAMQEFAEGFRGIDVELDVNSAEMEQIDTSIRQYYQDEYLTRLVPNVLEDKSIEEYWPPDTRTRILQNLYLTSNPNPTGSKHLLVDAGDGSPYSETHQLYHPVIRDYLERFGYYDIFLVNLDGDLVYTVFKEVDYGTSLETGPYSETNFAEAFRAARDADEHDFFGLVDFEPYHPSYNAPAAFIASPIFDQGQKIGVLIFQMPIDRINNIMTNYEQWSDVGLGESGETYIVGEDYTLRNQSRFLIEDSENYFKMIEEIGESIVTIGKIMSLNNSIGLQRVQTEGTEAALAGETGTAIFPDYRGVSVLSSFKPLNIADVNWAIMSEIDEAEAFRFVTELRNRIFLFLLVTILGVVIAAILFSRSITRPLVQLTGYANELSEHDFNESQSFVYSGDLSQLENRGDEVADLANAFEVMHGELELSIDNLVESTTARERMQSELNIGRDIQMSMLPLIFPAFPEHDEFVVYARLLSAREVGGDFYDFFFIDEQRICLCIGDVSGKGVPAALFMAVTKTLIKSRAMEDPSTASIITHVNDELSVENKTFMFATVFLGILDIRSGEMLYTNAGHNPPYLLRSEGDVELLDSKHGLVVGPMQGSIYKEQTISLNCDDTLVLYTDGVPEAMNAGGDFFGDERLAHLLSSMHHNSVEETVESVVSAVIKFESGSEQSDDITMLALHYRGEGAGNPDASMEMTIGNQIEDIGVFAEGFQSFAESHDVPMSIIHQLQIVFEELLSNIIKYAWADDESHDIGINVTAASGQITAIIVDDGDPFNPLDADTPDVSLSLEERDIGGLGIHLIRNMVDEIQYRRISEENEVTFIKYFESDQ